MRSTTRPSRQTDPRSLGRTLKVQIFGASVIGTGWRQCDGELRMWTKLAVPAAETCVDPRVDLVNVTCWAGAVYGKGPSFLSEITLFSLK